LNDATRADIELLLCCLLHDAPEAYLGDMVRPLKVQPEMKTYRQLEQTIWMHIGERFGLPVSLPPAVKRYDNQMLRLEAGVLMPPASVRRWNFPDGGGPIAGADRVHIYEVPSSVVYSAFMQEFRSLSMQLKAMSDA
jgi:hypothetical protein